MTSVNVDLQSHPGEDFARDGPEIIGLGTCEECQVGIIYLCFRRFSLEDTHKFTFVGTVDGCQSAMAVPGVSGTSLAAHASVEKVRGPFLGLIDGWVWSGSG
jgi:hypothetical protein